MSETINPITLEDAHAIAAGTHPDDSYELWARLRHPDTSLPALEFLAAADGVSYNLLTSVAENPNATETLLATLAARAWHRWEWRAINSAFGRLAAPFPADHPFAPAITDHPMESAFQAASYVRHAGPAMAQDLWHELAVAGRIELGYQPDTVDGDHFGPIWDENVVGVEAHTPAEYLLTSGYDTHWIDQEPDPDIPFIEEDIAETLEYFIDEEGILDYVGHKEPSPFTQLLAIVYGQENGLVEIASDIAYRDLVIEAMEDHDPERLDVTVEIIDTPGFPAPRYGQLTGPQRTRVIMNLVLADTHWYPQSFDLVVHLLSLLALHPHTSEEQRELIRASHGEKLRRTFEFLDNENS